MHLCSFGGVQIALFSAGGSISKKFGPLASDAGATVRAIQRSFMPREAGSRSASCLCDVQPPHEWADLLCRLDVTRVQV